MIHQAPLLLPRLQVPSLAINYCAYETLRSRWLCLTRTDTPTVRHGLPARVLHISQCSALC